MQHAHGKTCIDATAVYSDGDLRLMLGITSAALLRARRSGNLRHMRAGRRLLYRGQWVIDWLDAASGKGGAR